VTVTARRAATASALDAEVSGALSSGALDVLHIEARDLNRALQALGEELVELEQHMNGAAASAGCPETRSELATDTSGGTSWAVLVAGITLAGFWLLTPSREELKQLRSSIDALAQRGGRADFKTCGIANAHLCIRVEPRLGRYGEEKDYFVVKGY
jgi:hypothetical protein